jgi:hypothetical protein
VQVGDFVQRLLGVGDSQYGRIIAAADGRHHDWLVTAGGYTYRDREDQLSVIPRRPDRTEPPGSWQSPLRQHLTYLPG